MLKGLKSLFVVEVEEAKKEKTPASAPIPPPEAGAAAGKVNPKFVDVLFTAMRRHDPEGFDYMEFRKSLQSLKKMDMDERTRFQSAFAMAQTMGADLDGLVRSAGEYLRVLEQEKTKFGQAMQSQQARQVGQKSEQLDKARALIAEKQKQIAILQQEIDVLRQQTEALQQDIHSAQANIRGTAADFSASFSSLFAQIEDDIRKIKQYLA